MCLAWKGLKRASRSRPVIRAFESVIALKWVYGQKTRYAYSNLEVHKLLRECAHLVIEAESVFSRLARSEDEVTLTLLFTIHDDLVPRSRDLVIDIERSSCLDLCKAIDQ